MATSVEPGGSGDAADDAATNVMLGKNEARMKKIFLMLEWSDKDENKDKKDKIDIINKFDEKHGEISAKDQADSSEIEKLDADIDKFMKENNIETTPVTAAAAEGMGGGRRRSSSARKSSSRRGRRSAKKRGTKRKQKRRQRRASRRAY